MSANLKLGFSEKATAGTAEIKTKKKRVSMEEWMPEARKHWCFHESGISIFHSSD